MKLGIVGAGAVGSASVLGQQRVTQILGGPG
jgi:hypothetical protein